MIIDKNFSPVMEQIISKQNLSREESSALMDCLLDGTVSDARMAAILTALRFIPFTLDVMMGALESILKHGTALSLPSSRVLVDCCGTGGDSSGTFNISTMAAVVASAAGAEVAKFGARSVASRCGSADVLDALGVKFAHTLEDARADLKERHISFLYATSFYPGIKHLGAIRKSLGFHTVLDVLYPLMNPVPLTGQLMGVYSCELLDVVAQCLAELGRERALVVSSQDGLDELSVCGPTHVKKIIKGNISSEIWTPEMFNIPKASMNDIRGGAVDENSEAFVKVMRNQASEGLTNAVCLNAGAVLWCASIVDNVKDGFELAKKAVQLGKAEAKYTEWKSARH